jgi:membrane protein DedA with SNARE-associated domain
MFRAMLLLASITDPLVRLATHVIDALGLPGVFALMVAESACIPIPSEATMLFAGFNVSDGHWSLLEITVAGVLGNLVGSWIAYAVGWFGRVDVLERHGHRIGIRPSHIAQADRWFARYGAATVLVCRLLPVVRTFISLPAGVARMPFWRFTALTVIGCVPWVLALGFIGRQAGESWSRWKDSLHYVDYAVVAAVVVLIAWLVLRRRRRAADATVA